MREQFIKLILEKLSLEENRIREDFRANTDLKTRFSVIDDLLPESIARKIFISFPAFKEMNFTDNLREKKYASKDLNEYNPIIADITLAFHDERIIKKIEEITGFIELKGDPELLESRVCAMSKGHFLNPHLDSSHDQEQKNYRVLNLVYYCSPDWKVEYGGNLEIWNENVTEAIEIPSIFNRLVLMETNDKSWHSVNKVKKDGSRCCISNYYFSPHSPNGYETKHITYFKARPEQKFRRILTKADSNLRTVLRKVKNNAFEKKK